MQAMAAPYDAEREALCDQVVALTDELEARAKQLDILKRAMAVRAGSTDFERSGSLPLAPHRRSMSNDSQSLQHETDLQACICPTFQQCLRILQNMPLCLCSSSHSRLQQASMYADMLSMLKVSSRWGMTRYTVELVSHDKSRC